MARTAGTTARTQRLITLVATCLLAGATGLAIGRVFLSHAATYRLVSTAVVSAVLAVALERRNLLLATLASAGAMVVVVGIFVFPESTWYGTPTPETVRAMIHAAGLVGEQARVQVAPTDALPPLMLAALAATWAAVFSAHALAFRAGSPLLALLPPIALVAFADSVLEETVQPLFGVAFLIAATAVIFADGLRRVQGWGPIWAGPGRQARLSVSAGRGARRVAAAAVALAAVSPLLLPGFGSQALLDFSSRSDDQVRLDPLVSVKSSLNRDDPTPVFEVRTSTPSYWRMVALPDFDGSSWRPDLDAATIEVDQDTQLTTNAAPGEGIDGTAETPVSVSFRTSSALALPWLPLPYPPGTTDAEADGLRWDPEGGSLAIESTIDAGTTYNATMRLVRPSPDALRAQGTPSITEIARYTRLPDDLPGEIAALAADWTQGAGTTYDKVIAIQDTFTSPIEGFAYDTDVPARDDQDALLDFLTDSKRGFCQQFASSMAVMLRSLGIPARVAVGFTAGEFDDSADVLKVSTDQAHAWVEVLFPDYGWLAFEPTPGRRNVVAYPYTDPSTVTCQPGPQGGCGTRARGPRGQPTNVRPGTLAPGFGAIKEAVRPGGLQGGVAPGDGAAATPERSGPSPRQWLGIAVLLGLVLLALVPPARAWRRRRRVRHSTGRRDLILTTYDVFTERAGELGFPRSRGQTPEEYRDHVIASGELDGAASRLSSLTSIAVGAAYSPRDPADAEATEAAEAAEATLSALRRNVGIARRLRGIYLRR
jgi:transglutaminase-like putative cysteine protease